MDIEYLLFLQSIRIEELYPLMQGISDFGVHTIVFLPAFVYWAMNKKSGLYVLFSWRLTQLVNAWIKLTACVYRPWVRDARVIPAGDAMKTAGGYSFPSGHTMMAGPIYGGLAVYAWKKGVKWLSWIFIIAILVTMFSRNYLGVHTPQDVLVGFAASALCLWIVAKVFAYLDAHPEKEDMFLVLCLVLGALSFVYISVKSYPMDYVDGKLLVDPDSMTVDAWGDIIGLVALAVGRYIERKWVKFEVTGVNVKGVVLCVIGMIPLYFLIINYKGYANPVIGKHWAKLTQQVLISLYVVLLWPVVLKLFSGKKKS